MQAPVRIVCPPAGKTSPQFLHLSRQAFLLQCLLHESCTLSRVLLHRKVPPFDRRKAQPLLQTCPFAKRTTSLADGGSPANPNHSVWRNAPRKALQIRIVAIAWLFGGPLAALRALLSALPPDFSQRWRAFFEECGEKELPSSTCTTEKKSCVLYDRHGEVITTVTFTSQFSFPSQDSAIPTVLWQAVVACEDRRFFRHPGIDPRGLARAALSFSRDGGGSTITQQLVKNVFLTSERRWTRKFMEMFLALALESRMSKWDILQVYLKKIYWGHGNYGVDAAAIFYFGKSACHLNVGECAMLAGMIPAPEVFSPFHDPSRGKRAQKRALQRMVEVGFLNSDYAAAILSEPLELTRSGVVRNLSPCRASFFVDEVLKVLIERYGYRRVSEGGLKIYTTLDLKMQELAEKVVNERVAKIDTQQVGLTQPAITQMEKQLEELQMTHDAVLKTMSRDGFSKEVLDNSNGSQSAEQTIAKNDDFSPRKETLQSSIKHLQEELKVAACARLEAALVLLDHSDGGVLALIGGREQVQRKLNWSTEVYRSPGTAFMPVIYLAALAETLSIRELLKDEASTVEANFRKESMEKRFPCDPKEFCEKLSIKVEAEKVCEMGKRLGIESPSLHDPNLALEDLKTTPMQLASVYSTIGSGGVFHRPFFVTRVETAAGITLEENKESEWSKGMQ